MPAFIVEGKRNRIKLLPYDETRARFISKTNEKIKYLEPDKLSDKIKELFKPSDLTNNNKNEEITIDNIPDIYKRNCLIYDNKNNLIDIDLDCFLKLYKQQKVKEIDEYTQKYLDEKFKELDWGKDEDSALASINNTKESNQEYIFNILIRYNPNITTDEIRKKVLSYINGNLTKDDAIKEMKNLKMSDEDIQKVLYALEKIIEAGLLSYWDEQCWDICEQTQKQIQNAPDKETIDKIVDSFKLPEPPQNF